MEPRSRCNASWSAGGRLSWSQGPTDTEDLCGQLELLEVGDLALRFGEPGLVDRFDQLRQPSLLLDHDGDLILGAARDRGQVGLELEEGAVDLERDLERVRLDGERDHLSLPFSDGARRSGSLGPEPNAGRLPPPTGFRSRAVLRPSP